MNPFGLWITIIVLLTAFGFVALLSQEDPNPVKLISTDKTPTVKLVKPNPINSEITQSNTPPLAQSDRKIPLHFSHPSQDQNQTVFKWTDENGQIHYGDRRPTDAMIEVNAVHLQTNAKPRKVFSNSEQRPQEAAPIQKPMKIQQQTRPTTQLSKNTKNNIRCEQAEQSLDWIKARMRQGYKAREADRLHRRELVARENRRKFCQ